MAKSIFYLAVFVLVSMAVTAVNCNSPSGAPDSLYCTDGMIRMCDGYDGSWFDSQDCAGQCLTGVGTTYESVCEVTVQCDEPFGVDGDLFCDSKVYVCDRGTWQYYGECEGTCKEGTGNVDDGIDSVCKQPECSEATDCSNSDPCKTPKCVNSTCSYTMMECKSGFKCENGTCTQLPACTKDLDCDDKNPLTVDKCTEGKCSNAKDDKIVQYLIIGGTVAVFAVLITVGWLMRGKKR